MCKAGLERGQYLCAACNSTVQRITAPYCSKCSQPFDGAIEQEFTCSNCEGRRFHFECAVTRCQSRGAVRDLVLRFKYQGEYYLRHTLADWMMEGFEDTRIIGRNIDFLVPVPLHPARERERQ